MLELLNLKFARENWSKNCDTKTVGKYYIIVEYVFNAKLKVYYFKEIVISLNSIVSLNNNCDNMLKYSTI